MTTITAATSRSRRPTSSSRPTRSAGGRTPRASTTAPPDALGTASEPSTGNARQQHPPRARLGEEHREEVHEPRRAPDRDLRPEPAHPRRDEPRGDARDGDPEHEVAGPVGPADVLGPPRRPLQPRLERHERVLPDVVRPPRHLGVGVRIRVPGDDARDHGPCDAEDRTQQPDDDDRDRLPRRERFTLAAATGPGGRGDPLDEVEQHREREGEQPRSRERVEDDEREHRPIPPLHHEEEQRRREQEPHRLGVGDLEDRRHRVEAEERDGGDRLRLRQPARHEPLEDERGPRRAEDRDDDGDQLPPRIRDDGDDPREPRVRGEERPRVVPDEAVVAERQRRRVADERDDERYQWPSQMFANET